MGLKYRKAVFIVVYSGDEYLLLKRKLHWKGWEFPKGGLEKGEKIRDAIKREVKEEVGLRVLKIKKFKISGKYKYDKVYVDRKDFVGQSYVLYSAEVKKGKVKVDSYEHNDFRWVSFGKAVKKLTWENQKRCLRIVERELN